MAVKFGFDNGTVCPFRFVFLWDGIVFPVFLIRRFFSLLTVCIGLEFT